MQTKGNEMTKAEVRKIREAIALLDTKLGQGAGIQILLKLIKGKDHK